MVPGIILYYDNMIFVTGLDIYKKYVWLKFDDYMSIVPFENLNELNLTMRLYKLAVQNGKAMGLLLKNISSKICCNVSGCLGFVSN